MLGQIEFFESINEMCLMILHFFAIISYTTSEKSKKN
jgi:hypothetical protein